MNDHETLDEFFDQWRQRIETLLHEHPLQIISWEATRRCNLSCAHCGSPTEEVGLGIELTTEEIIGAFDQVARDFDMSQFRHVNITGGEPFVREDLVHVLQRISRHACYRNIDIQTNGVVLAERPKLLDVLRDVGVTGLGISIDGLESTHDAFRRCRGSFAKAFHAAQLAVQAGYVVTVSVVAFSRNIDEIPMLFEQVKRHIRPRVFRIMLIDPLGRAAEDSSLHLSSDQMRRVILFLRDEYSRSCKQYTDPSATMVELGCGGWLGRRLEGTVRPMIFHCIAGIVNLGILHDGKLAACSNISRSFVEGDLRQNRILDVWNDGYRRYRDSAWRHNGECASCDEWNFCHGGPMHAVTIAGRTHVCIYRSLQHDMSDAPTADPLQARGGQ